MYFLQQIRIQFFSNICSYQTGPESTWSGVENAPDLGVSPELNALRAELEAIEFSEARDNEKVEAYKILLVKMLHDEDVEDSEADIQFREKVEWNIISIQKRQIENALAELQSKLRGIESDYPDIFERFSGSIETLVIDMSPDASSSDIISHQEVDRDKILSEIERLRVAIVIFDSPESISVRHDVLEQSFWGISQENLEGLVWNSIDSLTAGDIYALKQRGVDLATIFVSPPTRGEAMNTWSEFVTNFGDSESADKMIGAGDILPIERVYSVKINNQEAVRGFSPRPWYYSVASWKYLPIYDGYKIEIWEIKPVSEQEKSDLNQARQQRFTDIRTRDIRGFLQGDQEDVNFSHESDINVLEGIISGLNILGLAFNRDNQSMVYPDGMVVSDLWEALDNYSGIKTRLRTYIEEHSDQISYGNNSSQQLHISAIEGYSPFLLTQAISSLVKDRSIPGISFDAETGVITSTGETDIQDIFWGSMEYEGSSTRHLRYMSEVRHAAAQTWVPEWAIVKLIYKENHGWDPTLPWTGSTAYGLGQMIDGTWRTYGRGLDRNNPGDQLLATARYMKGIQTRKDCPWEHVLAYYNTWEWIRNVSRSQLQDYADLNWNTIASKIPWGRSNLNTQTYFIAAVAYYNSISYEEARETL